VVFALALRAPALPRAAARPGPLLRIGIDRTNRGPFLHGVAWMAPFVFAFPGIAFATLPVLAGGKIEPSYVGALAALTLAAGMAAQPFTRRFAPTAAARVGLLIGAAGVLLGTGAVARHATLPLLAATTLLGVGYGVCMTSGLRLVETLSRPETRAGLAGLYYVLTYVGFGTPLALALAARKTTPTAALLAVAALALVAAVALRAPPGRAPKRP
jgi:MFS family permease